MRAAASGCIGIVYTPPPIPCARLPSRSDSRVFILSPLLARAETIGGGSNPGPAPRRRERARCARRDAVRSDRRGRPCASKRPTPEARIAFIRSVMRDQGRRVDSRRWGWERRRRRLAAGQYALVPALPARQVVRASVLRGRRAFYLPLSLAVFPLRIQHYSDILERVAIDAEGPKRGHMMPCLVLDRAEGPAPPQAAKDEAQLTGALMQVATVVLSVGYGAIFAFGFRDLAGHAGKRDRRALSSARRPPSRRPGRSEGRSKGTGAET